MAKRRRRRNWSDDEKRMICAQTRLPGVSVSQVARRYDVKGKCATARIWTYVRDERPWASDDPPAAWYQFSTDREGKHPADHLSEFNGWMHADGYSGFNKLYRSGKVQEVACMAHVRRKFADIFKASGLEVACEAIKRIALPYRVEKEARGKRLEDRVLLRQKRAKPIFDDLEAWLNTQLPRIPGKYELAIAIRYALTRMKKLHPYLDHGFLENR